MYFCTKNFKMINHVRQTVLTVLNKENRGFLTPGQFNLYAKHAQETLFTRYFAEYNRLVALTNNRRSSDVYGDKENMLRKTIERFVKKTSVTQINQKYSKPLDLYHLVSVRYNNAEVEELEKRNELFLLNSNLTGPSENFPVYIDVDDFISVKPDTVTSNIDVVYVRKLRTPKWTMSTDFGTIEEPVFTSSALDYQDFELPVEAEAKLVVEILKLAGVTIRETEITQLAQGLDQQETQKENM